MYNPFRSRDTQHSLEMQKQKDHIQRQKQVQQTQQVNLQKLQDYLESFMKMKSVENKMYLHCASSCLNFEGKFLESKEEECLKNCNKKIEKYISLSRTNFNNIEEGISDITQQYTKNVEELNKLTRQQI